MTVPDDASPARRRLSRRMAAGAALLCLSLLCGTELQAQQAILLRDQAVEAASLPASTVAQLPSLRIQDRRGARGAYRRGESYEVDVAVGPKGFLYCYLIDARRRPAQFFPNPQMPDAAVAQGSKLRFPGMHRFSLVAARAGGNETVMCLNSPKNLGSTPTLMAANDGGAIKARFERLAGAGVQLAEFVVHVP